MASHTDKAIKKYIPMSETAFYILLTLYAQPQHGYGIVKYVEHLTDGRLTLGSGTVYGTITKMLKDHLIVVYANEERKKIYEITELGIEVIEHEMTRLEELHKNALAHWRNKHD
ncbi:Transcriptional regulator PadR-like family protein [Pelagirhabdus alkalitolerans]|uniref:Transcriptional regulator PadR-like family protein n=1 Tax=Pelagirhabdus alkalitolerans TaxID=1612202 RepID=A0A1G6GJ73_9BACI|nr:PadR family transcriptional regulator [Pelagirhabdus alkalitolerans]SDB81883.1 Transcriptional regulator PadR-like family protein [Pelagirhabdus alkalitolerans]